MSIVYDAIVLGLGGVGGSAAYHLAARGQRVLGLEAFDSPHDRGSSHGQTRIIRQAYFEHPNYVPLLKEAYRHWSDLELQVNEQLYFETGLLEIGPASGEVIAGVLASKREHQLEVDELTSGEFDFPGLLLPEDSVAVFERRAGFLKVEKCVAAHLKLAQQHGAELRFNTPVHDIQFENGAAVVSLADETVRAGSLVVAAGAWSTRWLQRIEGFNPPPLRIMRKHQHWFENNDPRYEFESGLPVFLYERPEGMFYGFPQLDDRGMKLAHHGDGDLVTDADTIDRRVDVAERQAVVDLARDFLPGLSANPIGHSVCMYTVTDDHHFRIARVGDSPAVAFACGLSGHGFKFTSLLGSILADLTLQGATNQPIGFLRC